tara:strand:+ start:4768 stop:6213 length:1446 start_codon:yes stop_codon:yes gene_type:complete
MDTPNFLINDYIKNFSDLDTLKNTLFKKGIMTKLFPEDNLLLVYTKFEEDKHTTTPLKNECRSLIIDIEKKELVSYTCNTPICNLEAMNYLLGHNENQMKIYECYEGTLMSLFYNNNQWYLSTRRCLDSKKSIWNDNSHFDLFEEVLKEDGFSSLDDFTLKLNSSYCYNFVLIHHKNKNIVDYSSRFGTEYKKLCLAFVRNKKDLTEIEYDKMKELIPVLNNIFIPNEYESLAAYNSEKNKFEKDSMEICSSEGAIVKINNENNINIYLKLQTYPYQFNKAIGLEKNIFKGFVNLYQNEKLAEFLEKNSNLVNYKKIVNPINTQESYDTIGVVDSVFKVCTSELYELFKLLWNLKTGKQVGDNLLYNILPKEYKTILYGIRGIYFKNKSNSFNQENKSKIYLQIKDIYQHIKTIDTDTFEQFLRVRKLMLNWIKADQNNENLKKFNKISEKCDKVHFKLTAIFTNKLFPNIMPDDLPDVIN